MFRHRAPPYPSFTLSPSSQGGRVRAARTSTVAALSTLIATMGGAMGRVQHYDLIYGGWGRIKGGSAVRRMLVL